MSIRRWWLLAVGTLLTSVALAMAGQALAHIGVAPEAAGGIRTIAGGASDFYRGAAAGELPSFALKANDYRMTGTGVIRGLSLFNDPAEITARGMVPWEVDQSTVSELPSVEQRGANLAHYEAVPAGGVFPAEEEFQALLDQIGGFPQR